jgi:hypothetical protein
VESSATSNEELADRPALFVADTFCEPFVVAVAV